MRMDKYLWCIRQYKTRNQATDAVRKGRVECNDMPAKAAQSVKPGDRIVHRKNGIHYHLEVKELPPSRVGAKLLDQYRADHTPAEELEKLAFKRMMHTATRQKGQGRPTKKDRRHLDDFKGKPKD